MIITQFRKYTPTNMVLLLVLGLVICLIKLYSKDHSFGFATGSGLFISYGLILIQAFYLNKVMNNYNFFGKPGFLVALLYLVLASIDDSLHVLSPILICNFIFIRMIDKLIGIYHREQAMTTMFDLGMLVGVGSLIYFPFAAMLLPVWVGLRLFRPFFWREWLAPILGFLTVMFLVWVYFFWLDQTDTFIAFWPAEFRFSFDFTKSGFREYLVWASVFVTLILFLNVLRENIFKRVVQIRKIVQLLMVMLLAGFLAFFLDQDTDGTQFLLVAIPLSIYAAYYFHFAATKWFYESVFILLLLTIVVLQFL